MSLKKKNLETDISQAIASKLSVSKELSAKSLSMVERSAEKLAGRLFEQFEKEQKKIEKAAKKAVNKKNSKPAKAVIPEKKPGK